MKYIIKEMTVEKKDVTLNEFLFFFSVPCPFPSYRAYYIFYSNHKKFYDNGNINQFLKSF